MLFFVVFLKHSGMAQLLALGGILMFLGDQGHRISSKEACFDIHGNLLCQFRGTSHDGNHQFCIVFPTCLTFTGCVENYFTSASEITRSAQCSAAWLVHDISLHLQLWAHSRSIKCWFYIVFIDVFRVLGCVENYTEKCSRTSENMGGVVYSTF